jgi:hypothetical protein
LLAPYSSDGAVQYAIAQGAKKIVFDQANSPINAYIFAGPTAVATAAHRCSPISSADPEIAAYRKLAD